MTLVNGERQKISFRFRFWYQLFGALVLIHHAMFLTVLHLPILAGLGNMAWPLQTPDEFAGNPFFDVLPMREQEVIWRRVNHARQTRLDD